MRSDVLAFRLTYRMVKISIVKLSSPVFTNIPYKIGGSVLNCLFKINPVAKDVVLPYESHSHIIVIDKQNIWLPW